MERRGRGRRAKSHCPGQQDYHHDPLEPDDEIEYPVNTVIIYTIKCTHNHAKKGIYSSGLLYSAQKVVVYQRSVGDHRVG